MLLSFCDWHGHLYAICPDGLRLTLTQAERIQLHKMQPDSRLK